MIGPGLLHFLAECLSIILKLKLDIADKFLGLPVITLMLCMLCFGLDAAFEALDTWEEFL